MTTQYALYHPITKIYHCDTIVRDDDSAFNKAGVNDPTKENFNPHAMIWIQRPDGFSDAMRSMRTQNKEIEK